MRSKAAWRESLLTSISHKVFGKGLEIAGEVMEFHQSMVVIVGDDHVLGITSYVNHLRESRCRLA